MIHLHKDARLFFSILFQIVLAQGYYFSNATVYDTQTQQLRPGMYLLVGETGRIEALGLAPISTPPGVEKIENCLILPHYSDFYSLLQERGLGFDQDLDLEHQKRMAETFRQLGIGSLRDPVFPPQGLSVALDFVEVFAQRGYLALQGSAGASFCVILDPKEPLEYVLEKLPSAGPITLWWTSRGTQLDIKWQQHKPWLAELVRVLHRRDQKVGAFVEGATEAEVKALAGMDLDFLEGLPDNLEALRVNLLGKMTWIPLLALNDKRYCADSLDARLISLKPLKLYDFPTLQRARGMVRQAQATMLDRCKVWKKRRPAMIEALQQWVANGGELGIGSAGGHPFSFSGELRPELGILAAAGLDEQTVLKALFVTTPNLLGSQKPAIKPGKPAHFIVYRNQTDGMNALGKPVDLNFSNGAVLNEPVIND